jgi:hypothetical protein
MELLLIAFGFAFAWGFGVGVGLGFAKQYLRAKAIAWGVAKVKAQLR